MFKQDIHWNLDGMFGDIWNIYGMSMTMQDLSKDRHIPDSQTIQTWLFWLLRWSLLQAIKLVEATIVVAD
jgi:hypothetical protein